MTSDQPNVRRPVRNFFIKKSIQIKVLFQIFLTILLTTGLTTLIISFHYISRSNNGNFFFMSNDVMMDLKLVSILGIVLPAIITAQTISILIAIGIGLFSSRKIAVPLYKVEKWASRIKTGKLNTTLAFREKNEMKELTIQCNAATDFFRKTLLEIRQSAKAANDQPGNPAATQEELRKILEVMQKIEF